MPGHIHESKSHAVLFQKSEAEITRNAAPLFLFKPVGVCACQRLDQRGFAVVDVPGGADNYAFQCGLLDRNLGKFIFDATEGAEERSNLPNRFFFSAAKERRQATLVLFTLARWLKIAWRQNRWQPRLHGIFGGAHESPQTSAGGRSSYSVMAEGGADYRWNPRVSFRLEGDYARTGFFHESQNCFQLAGGIVFHF